MTSNYRRLRLTCSIVLFVVASAALVMVRAQENRDCPVRVTLLQVNDVYQFAPVDGGKSGGLARVLARRKKIMQEQPNTIFLLAGDTISPSIESNTYKGKQMIEAWNLIGLDYATFGNHEFDFGPDVLRQRVAESNFRWLAANVTDKKTGKLFADTPEFVVREFEGVKIGIFGILLKETLQTSRPGPDVEIADPCTTAARVIPKIRAAGAATIVALTHLSMAEDKRLARCSDVDVIIGGHEHTLLESMAGRAPIFKMTSDARELGRIDLNISRVSGKVESIDWQIIPITEAEPEDAAFAPLNEKYGPLLRSLEQVVGRTDVQLDLKSADVRKHETNMANFIADVFREATRSDVALVNGGSIRADTTIAKGAVLTRRDVLSMLPFNNRVVKIQISGARLREALEWGVASVGEEEQPGRFPQVSGIRFSYDAGRRPGSRLTQILVNGKPLDEKASYTLATTSYVAEDAGDGYRVFQGATQLVPKSQQPSESDILQKAIASVPAIAPKVEGRITRVDAAKTQSSCN